MQQLTGREEVKALPLQTIFEDALRGEDTAFGHSDADTFEFAKRHARTATQRLVDSEGQRFSGRVRVLTDPTALTITYCRTGTAHPAAPAARQRVERQAAVAPTGVVIKTRKLQGSSKPVGRAVRPNEYILEDTTLVVGEIIYGCQPGCGFSVGPVAAKGDDTQCSHCKRTNASALAEFGGILYEEGQEVLPDLTIQAHFQIEEGRRAVRITRGTGRKTLKQVRDGDLGEAITEAAEKARKARAKKGRESLARRRGSK
jgi:hypothetical protein